MKMETRGLKRAAAWLILLALALPLLLPVPAAANEYAQIQTKVNVLETVKPGGFDLSNPAQKAPAEAWIRARLAEANRILAINKTRTKLTLNQINPAWPDPTPPADGRLDLAGRNKLRTDGIKELKENFGSGQGYKFYLVDNWTDTTGWGLAIINNPIAFLREGLPANQKGGRGASWVHEFGHGMGLDDHTTPTPSKNLMRTGPHNRTATELTSEQAATIFENAKKRVAYTVYNDAQAKAKGLPPCWKNWQFQDGSLDPRDLPPGKAYADMVEAGLSAYDLNDYLLAEIELAGLPPAGVAQQICIRFCLNIDNNNATGAVVGGYPGIDRMVTIRLVGTYPFAVAADVYNTIDNTTTIIDPPQLLTLSEVVDAADDPPPTPLPLGYKLELAVPAASLGTLSSIVPVGVISTDEVDMVSDFTAFEFATTILPYPTLSLDQLIVELPWEDLALTGSNFTAGEQVGATLGSSETSVGKETADGSGGFGLSISGAALWAQDLFGESHPAEDGRDYFLDVVDKQGKCAYKVVTLKNLTRREKGKIVGTGSLEQPGTLFNFDVINWMGGGGPQGSMTYMDRSQGILVRSLRIDALAVDETGKKAVFGGTASGTVNGKAVARFKAYVEDNNGAGADRFEIWLYDNSGSTIYHGGGVVKAGQVTIARP